MRVTIYRDSTQNPEVFNTNMRHWETLEKSSGCYRIKEYNVEVVEEVLCVGRYDDPHGALTVLNGLCNVYGKCEKVVIEAVPITDASRISVGRPGGDVVVFRVSNDPLETDLRTDAAGYVATLQKTAFDSRLTELKQQTEQIRAAAVVVSDKGLPANPACEVGDLSEESLDNVY